MYLKAKYSGSTGGTTGGTTGVLRVLLCRVCVRAWVCACVRAARVCGCASVSVGVSLSASASGQGACPRACARVPQRPCGCVGLICVFLQVIERAFVRVCARMRSRASVYACVRSCARASVFAVPSASIFAHVLRVRERVLHDCVRMPRALCGRCGGTAGTGGISSSAGGAGRPRVRGCGSVRSALGVARVRPQVRRGRAARPARRGLRELSTRP